MTTPDDKNTADPALLHELGRTTPRLAKWVIVVTTALIGGGVFWSASTNVPGLARATGELTAQGPLRRVEHLEGGVVGHIPVAEGEIVQAGETIVVFSPTDLDLEISRIEERLRAARSHRTRLDALLSDLPADPTSTSSPLVASEEELQLQRAQVDLRYERRRAAADIIKERAATIRTMVAVEEAIGVRVDLAERRHDRARTLFERGAISRDRLQEAEDVLNTIRGEQLTAAANLAATRGRHADAERAYSELILSEREADLAALQEVIAEVSELETTLADLAHRRERLTLRAPVDGLVQSLAVSVPGEVVEPGGAVATILPTGVDLIAEIRMAPRDIGSISVGDDVAVSVTSFDRKRYGQVEGAVASISPTSVREDGEAPHYRVSVRLARQSIGRDGDAKPLRAGMMVQAEIVTNPRTVAEYLIKPLETTLSAALRER